METLLFMNIGIPEIALVLMVLLLPLYCIVDIVRSKFPNSNTNLLWIIVVLVAPVLGSIIYLVWGRSQKVSL